MCGRDSRACDDRLSERNVSVRGYPGNDFDSHDSAYHDGLSESGGIKLVDSGIADIARTPHLAVPEEDLANSPNLVLQQGRRKSTR